jgi:hypothetical protein
MWVTLHPQESFMKLDRSAARIGVDCSADPIGALVTMFVDMVQQGRIDKGQCPARRPVFLKQHGAARAEVRIRADLPQAASGGDLPAGQGVRRLAPVLFRHRAH